MNLIKRTFNNIHVTQREGDGYICVTDMSRVAPKNKKVKDYKRSARARKLHAAVQTELEGKQKHVQLYFIIRGGQGRADNTFVHPFIALDYASYISPGFGLKMVQWTSRYVTGDATLIQEVQERVDEIHGTKSLLTHTIVDKSESDQKLSLVHERAASFQAKAFRLQAELKSLQAEREKDAESYKRELSLRDHEVERLTQKLEMLGVDKNMDVSYLRVEQSRKRRRYSQQYKGLQQIAQSGRTLQNLLHQRDLPVQVEGEKAKTAPPRESVASEDEEQPGVLSMPARFLAMEVVPSTSGKSNKIVHSLIKGTFTKMGENLMKYKRLDRPTDALLERAFCQILGAPVDMGESRLNSNLTLDLILKRNVKRLESVQNSTHISLEQLYPYLKRYNMWVQSMGLPAEFVLVEQEDLERTLKYNGLSVPEFRMPKSLRVRQQQITQFIEKQKSTGLEGKGEDESAGSSSQV